MVMAKGEIAMKLMIKFLLTITILLLMTTDSLAAMPDISAGETYFDFSKGCYVLRNNVKVVDRGRTMTADEAIVQIRSQKVWATGNVTLLQEGIKFSCDKIFVQGLEKSVEVIGNVDFNQDDEIKITSDVGTFSWDSKVADFYGHVKISAVNINSNLKIKKSKINGTYDHIQYNIPEKKIIALDKRFKPMPNMKFPEPVPTDK